MALIWDTYGVLEDGPLGIWCPRGHIPAVALVLALSQVLYRGTRGYRKPGKACNHAYNAKHLILAIIYKNNGLLRK